jgi:hypothetical protein
LEHSTIIPKEHLETIKLALECSINDGFFHDECIKALRWLRDNIDITLDEEYLLHEEEREIDRIKENARRKTENWVDVLDPTTNIKNKVLMD